MPNLEMENALDVVNAQVAQLLFRWKLYGQLFNSGSGNIELLNKSGSNVFRLLQILILQDVMMSLSKLTDRAKTGPHENASIKNVVAKASAALPVATKDEVDALITKLEGHVQNVRVHRDKCLAHADLTHTLQASALPSVTYDELEMAMRTLQEIIAKVAFETCRWVIPTNNSVTIPFGTGGDALLRVLERGHRADTDG